MRRTQVPEGDVVAKSSSFAQKLRALREDKGLSKYALAKQAGLSKQEVSRLELGQREPSWATVQALTAALGVTCEAFAESVAASSSEPIRPRGRPRKHEAERKPPSTPRRPRKGK